jgi:hypothetical protein
MARSVLISIVSTAAVTAAAFVFNPDEAAHAAAIKAAVAAQRPLAGALGLGVLTAWRAEYHDYGVVSAMRLEGQWVSIGALGYVHVFEG